MITKAEEVWRNRMQAVNIYYNDEMAKAWLAYRKAKKKEEGAQL